MNRAEAIIDLAAIDANVRRLIKAANKPAIAVVKADAYGHGLVPVARQAIHAGASWLATALLQESIALRDAGIDAPTIAWLTPIHDDFESALLKGIDLGVPSLDHLNAIMKAAQATSTIPRIHLEVDTGMSRGGALSDWLALVHAASDLARSHKIKVVGIWSHFARADEPGHEFNDIQLNNFHNRLREARDGGLDPEVIHFSNSAATINNPAAHFDLVRLGIAMYGLSPDVNTMGTSAELGLIPAMSLRAQLHLVKDVPAGSQVGYGGTATTTADTKLGIVAMGYADGVPRNANSNAGVFVGNKMSPIIGRVSMDQFAVDLGKGSSARNGDWAYLLGSNRGNQNGDGYTADSWARASGTINYEIVTRIGPRVPRVYVNELKGE